MIFDDDPRRPPPWEPWESKEAYRRKLQAFGLKCLCGCGARLKISLSRCVPPPKYRMACFNRLPAQRKAASDRLNRLWAKPEYRRKQKLWLFKFTVSEELLKRHPDQAEWIRKHASQIDETEDVYPEHYFNGQGYELDFEGDFEFDFWGRTLTGFYNLNGDKVERVEDCRL